MQSETDRKTKGHKQTVDFLEIERP